MKFPRIGILFILLCPIVPLNAQTVITCPLQNAIIQKVSGFGMLTVNVKSDVSKSIKYRILDASGFAITQEWDELFFQNGKIDTSFSIPVFQKFTFEWKADNDSGKIGNLSVGHIYGIAGQSNAQGWSPPPFVTPIADIRMLRNDSAWQKGEDPTGGKYASPWIQMANTLYQTINDGLPIGIVNTAIDGTALVNFTQNGRWTRNEDEHNDTSTVYGKALTLFNAAGKRLECLCWIQGEFDAVGVTTEEYTHAFKTLIEHFGEDLNDKLKVFHLQIGERLQDTSRTNWGQIREAQRHLPYSILVGTAVGSPVSFDGIHFSHTTAIMVGDRFAGAIAKNIYNIDNYYFPPLLPQDSVLLTKCVNGDPYPGYKITMQCFRGNTLTRLRRTNALEGFQIFMNGGWLEPAKLFSRIAPNDESTIEIFSTDNSLSPTNYILLSYAITGELSEVNVSDDTRTDSLPNYLVSFMNIPVSTLLAGLDFPPSIMQNNPNPFSDATSFYFYLDQAREVNYTIYDILGKKIIERDMGILPQGPHLAALHKDQLRAGSYSVIFQIGNIRRSFKVILL